MLLGTLQLGWVVCPVMVEVPVNGVRPTVVPELGFNAELGFVSGFEEGINGVEPWISEFVAVSLEVVEDTARSLFPLSCFCREFCMACCKAVVAVGEFAVSAEGDSKPFKSKLGLELIGVGVLPETELRRLEEVEEFSCTGG